MYYIAPKNIRWGLGVKFGKTCPNPMIWAMASKNVPTNKRLYSAVKAEAKRKFKVYPSAYANGWLVKTYKQRGGGYRKA